MEHIERIYRLAQPSEITAGLQWYLLAHKQAERLARYLVAPIEVGAGVIAVLSPRVAWAINQEWSWRIARTFKTGRTFEEIPRGGMSPLGMNVAKAWAIIDKQDLSVMGGKKVHSFYDNILRPETSVSVTVDSWAYRIYLGQCGVGNDELPHGITPKRYEVCADAYKEVARKEGLLPSELQAITWVTGHRLEGKPA